MKFFPSPEEHDLLLPCVDRKVLPVSVGSNSVALVIVDLSENCISEIPDTFFSFLPNLQSLNLKFNFLTTLSPLVVKLAELQVLLLDNNVLNSLPDKLFSLPKLATLSLSNNKITELPAIVSNMKKSLKTLNLSENPLKILPKELALLERLSELAIYHTQLKRIPTEIFKLPLLESLTFEWFRYVFPPLPVSMKNALLRPVKKRLLQAHSELSFDGFCRLLSTPENSLMMAKIQYGRSPLHLAVMEKDTTVLETLLEINNNETVINSHDKDGYSPLGLAIKDNNTSATKILLNSSNVNISTGARPFCTLLHLAISVLNVEAVKMLLEKSLSPNLKDLEGNTPFHILFGAFKHPNANAERIGNLLLRTGADINRKNNQGLAPLHVAQLDAIKWVKKVKPALFDINLQSGKDKATALHIASEKGDYGLIQELLDLGADPLIRNAYGEMPRDVAKNVAIIFKMLYKKGLQQTIGRITGRLAVDPSKIRVTATRVGMCKKPGAEPELVHYPSNKSIGSTLSTDRSPEVKKEGRKIFISLDPCDDVNELLATISNPTTKTYEKYTALNHILKRNKVFPTVKELLLNSLNSIKNNGLRQYILQVASFKL